MIDRVTALARDVPISDLVCGCLHPSGWTYSIHQNLSVAGQHISCHLDNC